MIVRCPSCSTGFHLAASFPATILRCSRCREAFPCPAHRRSYVIGSPGAPPPVMTGPASIRFATPTPARAPLEPLEPMESVLAAPMAALDDALFAPQPVAVAESAPLVPGRAARRKQARRETAAEAGGSRGSLVPLVLAGVGAAAGWFSAPRLTDPAGPLSVGIAALPFAVEPWMVGAAGAAAGLLLGGVWLAWRAARR